ncbi:MAG: thioesterase family protein [Clostridia bacterium]|nr:thioesterase family protein [Clostridia bacterium]MBR6646587.1 thioesterase family protein [Clostridia bacterium]
MAKELTTGIKGKVEIEVDEKVSAKKAASGEMDVFGTPFVIALMERTADESVRPYLEDGCATVGTVVNIKHLSATPMGMKAYATSELLEVDGRRLVYKVEAYDEVGLIAEGMHERFIIFKEKFMEKTNNKGR